MSITYTFNKDLYSKTALLKASYSYTDRAYIHLDADEHFYIVKIESKNDEQTITEKEFINEMLTQSVRHEIYLQTKNIRDLMYARAMATSLVTETECLEDNEEDVFCEDEILKEWFSEHEKA